MSEPVIPQKIDQLRDGRAGRDGNFTIERLRTVAIQRLQKEFNR